MNKLLKKFGGERAASAFRKAVSGDPQGVPAWAHEMAIGDDIGFYGVDSDVWKVHGSLRLYRLIPHRLSRTRR